MVSLFSRLQADNLLTHRLKAGGVFSDHPYPNRNPPHSAGPPLASPQPAAAAPIRDGIGFDADEHVRGSSKFGRSATFPQRTYCAGFGVQIPHRGWYSARMEYQFSR